MSESPQSKFPRVAYLYERTFGQGPLHGSVLRAQRSYLRTLVACLRQMRDSPLPAQEPPSTDPQPSISTEPSSCEPGSASA